MRPLLLLLCALLLAACGTTPAANGANNATAVLNVDVTGLCCAGPGYVLVRYANTGNDIARDVVLTLGSADQNAGFAVVRATEIPAAAQPRAAIWNLGDLYPGDSGQIGAWLPVTVAANPATAPAGGGGQAVLGRYQAFIKAASVAAVQSRIYDQSQDRDRTRRDPDLSGSAVFSAVGRHYEVDFQGRHATVLGPAPEELLRLGGGRHSISGSFVLPGLLVVHDIAPD